MKKGLSILLIAAALFGFYGSAVNLNDVLACKDYWEKAGEESTANMNKLEDGLNQLKENEQAYLDGKDQVADGEVALAEGEQTLAEGEATLAKGEADYAAAPGKLADARRQLAAGEQQIADGKEAINGLTKLIAGIKKLRGDEGYAKWKKSYDALAEGRHKLYAGTQGKIEDLTALAFFLPKGSQKAYVVAVNDVAADDEKQTAKDYKEFIKSTNNIAKNLPVIQKNVKEKYKGATDLYNALKNASNNIAFAKTVSAKKTALLSLADLIEKANGSDAASLYKGTINSVADAIEKKYPDAIKEKTDYICNSTINPETGKENPGGLTNLDAGTVKHLMGQGMTQAEAMTFMQNPDNADAVKQIQAGVKNTIKDSVTDKVNEDFNSASGEAGSQLSAAKLGLTVQYQEEKDGGVIGIVVASLKDINDSVNGKDSAIKKDLQPGLEKFNSSMLRQLLTRRAKMHPNSSLMVRML